MPLPPTLALSSSQSMAEMILGYPLFRGRDNNDQLTQIMRIVGTPDERTLRKINVDSPEIVLRPFQRYPKQSYQSLIPRAPPQAIALLEQLLQFDPQLRCSAHDALSHPYFQPSSSSIPQNPAPPAAPAQAAAVRPLPLPLLRLFRFADECVSNSLQYYSRSGQQPQQQQTVDPALYQQQAVRLLLFVYSQPQVLI